MEQGFIGSARKYRPQRFDELIGQESIVKTITNAIEKNRLGQALLFNGPRGVGKTTCARIVAKLLNKDLPKSDLPYCIFEIDAASHNSVDHIRELVDNINVLPTVGDKKVYIIDEVHMLSLAAFNAFLKTLEEPPKHTVFILATTEKHKIIPTILSRCQIYDFKRVEDNKLHQLISSIAERENIKIDDSSLQIITSKSEGSVRDALSMFDMLANFSNSNIHSTLTSELLGVPDMLLFFEWSDMLLQLDKKSSLEYLNKVLYKGYEIGFILSGFCLFFKNMLISKDESMLDLTHQTDEIKEKFKNTTPYWDSSFIEWVLELLSDAEFKYKKYKNPTLYIEILILSIISKLNPNKTENNEPKKAVAPNPSPTPATTKTPNTTSTASSISSPQSSIKIPEKEIDVTSKEKSSNSLVNEKIAEEKKQAEPVKNEEQPTPIEKPTQNVNQQIEATNLESNTKNKVIDLSSSQMFLKQINSGTISTTLKVNNEAIRNEIDKKRNESSLDEFKTWLSKNPDKKEFIEKHNLSLI